jgi:hypothetical protein
MTDEAMSPLRRRMIEDMTIRKLALKTQHDYVQRVKNFAAFLGRSPDTASFDDVRRYQLHLTTSGVGVPTLNQSVATLRFFFRVTLKRHDMEHTHFIREPRKLPVVLSPEEVRRLLDAAPGSNTRRRSVWPMGLACALSGPERRRRWSIAEKQQLVAESVSSGLSVAEFARRHDVHPNLLHAWRFISGLRYIGQSTLLSGETGGVEERFLELCYRRMADQDQGSSPDFRQRQYRAGNGSRKSLGDEPRMGCALPGTTAGEARGLLPDLHDQRDALAASLRR